MKVFEIQLKVFLLQTVHQEYASSIIASFIDSVLTKDAEWERFHRENKFKCYTFNSFMPLAENGIYSKDQVYQILVRTVDEKLAMYFLKNLPSYDNENMKGLTCNVKILSQWCIDRLYSLSPVIVKGKEGGYWRDSLDFEEFEQRLTINLIKKYKQITGQKLDENFQMFTMLKLLNEHPIAVPYKEIKLLADKVQVQIAKNETAQMLAYLALGTGIGEMGSRGNGFVNVHYV